MEGRITTFALALIIIVGSVSCGHNETPTAPAVRMRDSLPVMTTYGVSKLISDSGVIRYKLVAEQWSVFDRTRPSKQTFMSGIFMEKFDPTFHVEMYLTADTAYWYDQNLWELRGRVEIRKKNGVRFNTEELFWDMGQHLIYSHKFMHIITPKEELQGVGFRSDEELTDYEFFHSAGSFPVPEEKASDDTVQRAPDVPPATTRN